MLPPHARARLRLRAGFPPKSAAPRPQGGKRAEVHGRVSMPNGERRDTLRPFGLRRRTGMGGQRRPHSRPLVGAYPNQYGVLVANAFACGAGPVTMTASFRLFQ